MKLALLYLTDGRMAVEVDDGVRPAFRLACPPVPRGARRQRVLELVLRRQYGEAVIVAQRDDPKGDTFAAVREHIADLPGAHWLDEGEAA